MPAPRELPSRARVVIVGGGVGGTAIAYHLARLGERDVVLLDRNQSFVGSGALGEPRARLRCLVLGDSRAVALGDEPVRIAGRVAGRVTSGGYGYTVGRSIAYAYLPVEAELGTEIEVDVFGEWVPGEVTREPLFDPSGERIRG